MDQEGAQEVRPSTAEQGETHHNGPHAKRQFVYLVPLRRRVISDENSCPLHPRNLNLHFVALSVYIPILVLAQYDNVGITVIIFFLFLDMLTAQVAASTVSQHTSCPYKICPPSFSKNIPQKLIFMFDIMQVTQVLHTHYDKHKLRDKRPFHMRFA